MLSRWQLVHGILLSHLTFRWWHIAQLNRTLGADGFWDCSGPLCARWAVIVALTSKTTAVLGMRAYEPLRQVPCTAAFLVGRSGCSNIAGSKRNAWA